MTAMAEEIRIYSNSPTLTAAAAEQFASLAREATAARGAFHVALAGGSTPKRLYHLLAGNTAGRYTLPINQIHFWFGDERHVAPEHSESNYRMAREAMFDALQPPASNVHRIKSEMEDAAAAAAAYEEEMRGVLTSAVAEDGFPRFDLILLGMGPDGHTASLFPDSEGLGEKHRWVIANWVEKFKTWRITFTFPVLNAASQVSLFVAGAEKAEMIEDVLELSKGTGKYPVQHVQPVHGTKTWMLDEAAAARLTKTE